MDGWEFPFGMAYFQGRLLLVLGRVNGSKVKEAKIQTRYV